MSGDIDKAARYLAYACRVASTDELAVHALASFIRNHAALVREQLEAERSTIDLTGEAMRDCLEYLHRNDGFRSLRVRVFDGEIKLEILTAAKGLEPIAEARGSLFHDAVASLKDGWDHG